MAQRRRLWLGVSAFERTTRLIGAVPETPTVDTPGETRSGVSTVGLGLFAFFGGFFGGSVGIGFTGWACAVGQAGYFGVGLVGSGQ